MKKGIRHARFSFQPLNPQHDIAGFRSGSGALDGFLQQQALTEMVHNWSCTTVMLERQPESKSSVIGYFTLRAAHEFIKEDGDKLPVHLPVVELVYLARHIRMSYKATGESFGNVLLVRALRQVLTASESIGIAGVQIMEHTEEGRKLYARHHFRKHPCEGYESNYFLSIPEIRLDVAKY